jgi:hypothetical protein
MMTTDLRGSEMELFSTMGTTELQERLEKYGPTPHGFMLLASIWKKWPTKDLAESLFQLNCMIEELESEVVSLSAQLIAAGVER